MENIENGIAKTQVSRSQLSDWSGAPVSQSLHPSDYISKDDRVQYDQLDYGNRTFDLFQEGYGFETLAYGPAGSPLSLYNLTALMQTSGTFKCMTEYFDGISYDSVDIRVTCSNPKGLCGGFFTGVFPFTSWNDQTFNSQAAKFGLNTMTIQHLLLSPHSQLVPYGSAQDVLFSIPWQYNVPYLPRSYIKNFSPTSTTQKLWPGSPVIYFVDAGSAYVSSVTMQSAIRVFVTFKGLKFYAPVLEPQSGVETLAAAAIAAAVGEISVTGAEILSDAIEPSSSVNMDINNDGAYENPQAVQLAYVGDSTKYGPPSCTPIFKNWGKRHSKHKILDYLKQPQFLMITNTSATNTFYANPTAPRGVADVSGSNQNCSYFRYFSQANSFWRGTILYDIVILGHPMVEVSYYIQLFYPPFSLGVNRNFSQNGILRGVCSGVYTITVPMPFMTPMDHLPIIDSKDTVLATLQDQSSSGFVVEVRVVSTALGNNPVIPVAVFYRAGDDFEFLQPYAVGLGFVESTEAFRLKALREARLRAIAEMEPQVKLPVTSEVFETRAKVQRSTSSMISMDYIEDYMEIWSRALPYSAYDVNDEPVVDIQSGISPYWWPQEDSSASYTLNVNNSWWVTNDFVSFYSSMFLYYSGAIGFKVLCEPGTGYKYLTLSTGDTFRQPGHNPFSFVPTQLPPHANFGYGTVATDLAGQPVIEATIPLRCSLRWAFTNPTQVKNVLAGEYFGSRLSGTLLSNIVLHEPESDLKDALYRKIGKDFSLAVQTLLPPPTLWCAKGYDWS